MTLFYHLILFTDFVGDPEVAYNYYGTTFIINILFIFGANLSLMLYSGVSDYRKKKRRVAWELAQQQSIAEAKEAAELAKRKKAVAAALARRTELGRAKSLIMEAQKVAAEAKKAAEGVEEVAKESGGSRSALVGLKEAAVRSKLKQKLRESLGQARAQVSRRRKSKKPTRQAENGLATIAENDEEDRADSYRPGPHPADQASGWPDQERTDFASDFSSLGPPLKSRKSQRQKDEYTVSMMQSTSSDAPGFGSRRGLFGN